MRAIGPRDLGFLSRSAFAHRGLHGAGGPIENSIAAFDAAIAAGHGIELDVRVTKDRMAVVFHDEALPRLVNADGCIADLTMAELSAMRLAGSDEPIRRLRDVIEHVAGRAPILIEIKPPGRRGAYSLCRAVRRDIEGASAWTAVMSFDPRIVQWFREHSPQTTRGLVVTRHGEGRTRGIRGWLSRHYALRSGDPHFLAYDIRSLPCSFAARCREKGMPVLAWTVRSDDERRTASTHADQIIFETTSPA